MSSHSGKRSQHHQRRKFERKIDKGSSSSSVADDLELEELNNARPRSISASSSSGTEKLKLRRRKRKRRSSSTLKESKNVHASSQKQKLINIERALLLVDSDDKEELDASDSPQCNNPLKTLRQLAISERGLVNDEMRKKVWPRLLNIGEVSRLYASVIIGR